MKKFCLALVLTALLCALLPAALAAGGEGQVSFYDEAAGRYLEPVRTDLVALTLDGEPLEPQGAPALVQYLGQDGRTLVPVRTVAEALGATVVWVPENRQVLLLRGEQTIVLTLGSASAAVDGVTLDLPGGVPAGVVKWEGKESTMVPLRFVSEQLGAQVEWDNDTFTAHIATVQDPEPDPDPAPTPIPTPTPPVSLEDQGFVTNIIIDRKSQSVSIYTDHLPEYRVTDFGDRVVVDLLGTVLASGNPELITLPVESNLISTVRYSQHGGDLDYGYPHTVRVVLDLKEGVSYQRNISVTAGSGGVRLTASGEPAPELPEEPDQPGFTPTIPLDPDKLTIVVDPGHGGARPGAVYPNAEGVDIIERDLTLAISLKLRDRLLEAGYNVVMTRETDIDVDLYERAEIANAVNADLFVSVHCNASGTVPTYQGIYTYYFPDSKRGEKLARTIQPPLCALTGAIDRGVSKANFVVLRETEMCAVLVETGFMSNVEELTRLCDPEYQEKVAWGIAEGVIQYLNDPYVEPEEPQESRESPEPQEEVFSEEPE
ncbi:MAG: AMIN domain-containing protein [Flavonifractor sp.]|jgi:N-acetylmuramoyl-L-alanine amidase|nr:AMIN domain-containing protein [Flavonifractor sp.]MCI9423986.1 AMIN domain-containing protein [Flavonifractor sp.]MCI9472468.1 AMIN domain-containing protein [Flavonifractor sp.]